MESASVMGAEGFRVPITLESQRKNGALLFIINLILFLGVIACACAPLSNTVKWLTTLSGVGILLVIDLIYVCKKDPPSTNILPVPVIITPIPNPIKRATLAMNTPFIDFLKKAGMKEADKRDFPIIEWDAETYLLDAKIVEIEADPKVPKNEISLLHGRQNCLYLPKARAILRPDRIAKTFCVQLHTQNPIPSIRTFVSLDDFEEDTEAKFKKSAQALKRLIEAEETK